MAGMFLSFLVEHLAGTIARTPEQMVWLAFTSAEEYMHSAMAGRFGCAGQRS